MPTTPTIESTPGGPKTNRIGLSVIEYKGGKTTLCAGCGHNAISERIVEAMYEMGVQPERVAKLSGIGCSSKSPAYFMNRSHSFNGGHGRDAGESQSGFARGERRRRHGVDRHWSVRSSHAAQSAHHLHH